MGNIFVSILVQNDRRNKRGNIVPAKIGILTSLITITYSLLFSLFYTLTVPALTLHNWSLTSVFSSLWTSRQGSWSWASWRTRSTAWCLLWCWRAGRSPWGRSSSSSTAARTRTKWSLSTRTRINERRWFCLYLFYYCKVTDCQQNVMTLQYIIYFSSWELEKLLSVQYNYPDSSQPESCRTGQDTRQLSAVLAFNKTWIIANIFQNISNLVISHHKHISVNIWFRRFRRDLWRCRWARHGWYQWRGGRLKSR